ncbi:hypothetical protein [Microlunatus parietis]|uniref:N-acetyltransferase domain-containing protein n=1 Tax=Microlunatus parietis TaxID=682979 RepID=A0A7Y9LD75_9ACTN|nr:hypothetical protein [Microlunatus parietis]NYE72613.1 hypothetical protein [Microlunatus parietis]
MEVSQFTTQELSTKTWRDYERFFRVNGRGSCGCMRYPYGRPPATAEPAVGKELPSRDLRRDQNLDEMRALIKQGRARGILVYGAGQVIGWCQYGRVEDLPITRTSSTPDWMVAAHPTSDWRITCFLTLLPFRRQGVATLALAVAVQSIRRQGGGWIEARPVVHCHYDPELGKARREFGPRSREVAGHLEVWPVQNVPRVGWVRAAEAGVRTAPHRGLMSMFERLGFTVAGRDGETGVLMRLHV